jgi:hypothetical protein
LQLIAGDVTFAASNYGKQSNHRNYSIPANFFGWKCFGFQNFFSCTIEADL